MSKWLYTLALGFSVGFSVAWILKPSLMDKETEATRLAPIIQTSSRNISSLSNTTTGTTISSDISNLDISNLDISSLETPQTEHPSDSADSPLARFKAHILAKRYSDAVAIYSQLENEGRGYSALRHWLLPYMEARLNDDMAFIDLSDTFLNHNYADIDILLLVARYNIQKGYFEEAVQTFEFAYQYAQETHIRSAIYKHFAKFMQTIDDELSAQTAWLQLIEKYRYIDVLDISKAQHRLRLAELYTQTGQKEAALVLLEDLRRDSRYQQQADTLISSLLASKQNKQRSQQANDYALALVPKGKHFLAPLYIGATDIHLLIDTGASMTSLSRTAFESLPDNRHFTYRGTRLFNTANGVTKGEVYQANNIQLGKYQIPYMDVVVLDQLNNENYSGLLGMNILSQFHFQIDQDEAVLKLRPR